MPSSTWANIAIAAAVLALLSALAPVYVRWRRRRAASLADPSGLLEPPARAVLSQFMVLGLSLLVVFASLQAFADLRASLALLLAAIACGTTSTNQGIRAAGVAAVAFAAAGVVSLVTALLPWSPTKLNLNLAVGCAVAGALFGWFAGFWRQQLLEGEAWTMAGRMIPAAAVVGVVCIVGGVAAAGRALADVGGVTSADAVPWVRASVFVLLSVAGTAGAVRNAAAWRRGWRSAAASE